MMMTVLKKFNVRRMSLTTIIQVFGKVTIIFEWLAKKSLYTVFSIVISTEIQIYTVQNHFVIMSSRLHFQCAGGPT